MVMGRWPTLHDENRARARRRDFLSKPRGGLVGSPPRLVQGLRGASGPDAARSGMPVGAEPRVEVEAHRGPLPVRGPDRLRANPAQLFEALVWWLRLGIQHQRILPASPQQNGAH